ncbi:MAG: PQQ-binding-like beta-propeller repeat protein [Bacteroidales bacterium]
MVPVDVAVSPAGTPPGTPPGPQEDPKTWLRDVYRWEVILRGPGNRGRAVAEDSQGRKSLHHQALHDQLCRGKPGHRRKRVYAYFGMNGLYCFSPDGDLLRVQTDLGAYETLNGWGTGASPVVSGDRVFVQVDNEESSFLVALDAATGEEIWRTERDEKTNYSTPFVWTNAERTELFVGGKRARSYDPATGDLLWELQVDGFYNIPSPVADREHIYFGNASFRDTPAAFFAVKAGATGDLHPAGGAPGGDVLWSMENPPLMNPSPVMKDGLIYILGSRGGDLSCVDAATGELVYQEKVDGVGACWASPWINGDKLYFMDEKGKTQVVKTGREFQWLGENTLEDTFWATVAVAGDAYLFRGSEKLYCIGI